MYMHIVDFYYQLMYTESMANKNRNSKNKTGLALACWILGFLILLIVFVVKQDEIYSNLKTTGFFERLFGKTPSFIEKHEVVEKTPENIDEDYITVETSSYEKTLDSAHSENRSDEVLPASGTEIRENDSVNAVSSDASGDVAAENISDKEKSSAVQNTEDVKNSVKEEKPAVQKFNAKLYFVLIGDDGIVSRKEIIRTIEKNDSPLTTNINLLLKGPEQQEKSKGCRSLIPENTRLLSASVRDGIAYLNFSEEFEFNRIGVDGYLAQLMQIVYTATEFSTVKSVQILIDGQKKEYLGSEGVWIGSPLSRSSF